MQALTQDEIEQVSGGVTYYGGIVSIDTWDPVIQPMPSPRPGVAQD